MTAYIGLLLKVWISKQCYSLFLMFRPSTSVTRKWTMLQLHYPGLLSSGVTLVLDVWVTLHYTTPIRCTTLRLVEWKWFRSGGDKKITSESVAKRCSAIARIRYTPLRNNEISDQQSRSQTAKAPCVIDQNCRGIWRRSKRSTIM